MNSWWPELEALLNAGLIEPAKDGSCRFVPPEDDDESDRRSDSNVDNSLSDNR